MSITIGSPAWITRSAGVVVRRGAVGPRGDDRRTRRARGPRRRAARGPRGRRRPRSARPAGRRRSRRRRGRRRGRRARSSSTSSASLRIRSSRRTAEASEKRAPGSTRWRPRTNAARSPSETATRRVAAGRPQRRLERRGDERIGSSVSSQVATVDGPRGDRRRSVRAGVASSRGAMSVTGAGGRDHEHRQPLERHRRDSPVEVAQVRARRRSAARRGRRPRPARRARASRSAIALGGGDRRSCGAVAGGRDRHRALRRVGRPGRRRDRPAIQAASTRSPCSNRAR